MPFSIVSPKRSSSAFSTCATRALSRVQLGIRAAHLPVEILDQRVEERLLLAELVAVADRATDDPAQHVAAAFVAGDHAVDDQERARADVVGDHACSDGLSRSFVPVSRAAASISATKRSIS